MARILGSTDGFVTEAEYRTAEQLRSLPDSWFIVANKLVATTNGTFEMDFIILANHRIIILDDKYWRGPITGSDLRWTLRGSEQRNSPLNVVDNYARRLRGFISSKGINLPETPQVKPIIGVVYMSYPDTVISIRDHRQSQQVLSTKNVLDRLQELDLEGEQVGFDLGPIRQKLRTVLYDTDKRNLGKIPKALNSFEIVERIEQRGRMRIYGAISSIDDQPYRLYVYQPASGESSEEFDREVESLQKLQDTGVVPRVAPPIEIGDHGLRLISVAIPKGQSWGALSEVTSAKEAIDQIDLAAEAFQSLARIHEAGVTHRGIDPSRVFVLGWPGDPRVVFTDFVFARIQDAKKSIAPEIDTLGLDDPYAAPEIGIMQSYSVATQSSDVFSLGIVALERVAGLNVSFIRAELDAHRRLPVDDGWSYLSQEAITALADEFLKILTRDPTSQLDRPTAREVAARFRAIAEEERSPRTTPSEVVDTRFKVLGLLGQGTFAETYRIEDVQIGDVLAAKRYRSGLNPQTLEAIKKEFITLMQIPGHPNLPKVFRPELTNPDFQFFMEYIEGENLGSKIAGGPLDLDEWANLMRGLLGAVGHMMQHGVVHRDIKPENIIIRDRDGQAMLIDFGSASLHDRISSGAGTPAYLPPEAWVDGTSSAGVDLYSAALTLLEAAGCAFPFEPNTRIPIASLPSSISEGLREAVRVLLRAIAYEPANRFDSANQLKRAIETALTAPLIDEETSETEVPASNELREWPTLLRGLFRGSLRGNGDNRGLDSDFAKSTYVQTKLDTHLWPEILNRHPAVVFLSGNPGDGKTAFLEEVRQLLDQSNARSIDSSDDSGWELIHNNHEFRACFDASESANDRSATEQLRHRLRGLEGSSPSSAVTVLIAINDGRLAEIANEFRQSLPWLTHYIEQSRQRRLAPPNLDDPVWIVDLKRRSYVSLTPVRDDQSVWRAMLNSMIESRRWASDSEANLRFPPALNAESLRNPVIAARLEYLFLLSHLRGDRHTTVRDLRSALAMIITGDLDYDNANERLSASESRPWSYAYWNIAFTTGASQDLVLGDLRWLDPARFPHPGLERYLYFHRRPEDAAERAKLFMNGIDETPPPGDDPTLIREWIAAVKRRLYFESTIDNEDVPIKIDHMELLPYHAAGALIDVLSGSSDGSKLLQTLLLGIGRSDGIMAARTSTDSLVLGIKRDPSLDLEVVTTFPTERFDLRPDVDSAGESDVVEVTPRTILLHYQSNHLRSVAPLRLNLDLVEVLWRLAEGLDPSSLEFQPIIEEMASFKSRLQRDVSDRLLVLDGTRSHWIEKEGDRLVRRDA